MKRKQQCGGFLKFMQKVIRIVRVSMFLIFLSSAMAFSASYSQVTKLTLNLNNVTVKEVIQAIEGQSEFIFFYQDQQLDLNRKVTIEVNGKNIKDVLNELFEGTNNTYKINNRQILIGKKERKEETLAMIDYKNTSVVEQQDKIVTGVVRDKQGVPLPGVSIIVKNTSIGTVTDPEGRFTLTVPENARTLVFSFVGMKLQEVPIGNQSVFQVVMEQTVIGVEEVVVTALGIEKSRKSLTYSTQQVDMDNLVKLKEKSLGNALAGKVAGLSVITSSGSHGVTGDARVVLRGERSLNSNNQPLIVVDGIPVSDRPSAFSDLVSRTIEGGTAPSGYQMNSLSVVNPDDVESINVLKGPAASALYGSSAQNGVIVITTKKGKMGKSLLEINSQSNFDFPYMFPELQNEYAQGVKGAFSPNSDIYSWGPKMTGQTVKDWTGKDSKLEPQPNNMKDFFRTGQTYSNSVSYSIGVEKATAYFSYSNTMAMGLVPTNNMQRHNFNLRVSSEVVKNLHADFKITYFNQKVEDDLDYGIDQFSVMYQLCIMPRSLRTSDLRNYYYYDKELSRKQNTWAPGSTSVNNPYWAMHANEFPNTTHRVNSFASFKYDFTDWLSLQVRGGLNINMYDSEMKSWWGTQYIRSGKGDYQTAMNKSQVFTGDALLTFRKQLSDDFRLSVNVGGELKDVYGRNMTSSAGGLTVENKFSLSYAQVLTAGDGESHIQKQGLYSMANLNFREYLFLDLTARNDWSSTLPKPYNYFYPSVGLSAIVTDMLTLPDIFSYMKVRGSYAEVGNDAKYSMIFQTYSAAALGPVGFLYPVSTKVPSNLIPEMTKSWEAGAEVRILDDRIGIDATLYKSNTFNQLILVSSPSSSGYSQGWINCGNIQNTGIELLLNASPVRSEKFRWGIDLNFTRNWNKVIELTETTTVYELSRGNLSVGSPKAVVGKPFGEIYTKGYERNAEGKIIVDAQGVPKITSLYTHYLGNYNYDWRGGLTNSFSYGNWNLSCLIDINYGGVRQSITEAHLLQSGTGKETLKGREDGFIFDGVKADGTPNDIKITAQDYCVRVGGRITNGSGEPFNHDATNSRLRELSLGYNIPVRNSSIKSLQVSMVGRNLFFIYNGCKWFDPDDTYEINVNGFGSESFSLPGTRTLGVNIRLVL